MVSSDTLFLVFLILGLVIFALSAIYYPMWAVLHKMLSKRLDDTLLVEPYFNKSEIVNYQIFPLSMLKSLSYIYLIAAPSLAKRKRFRDFKGEVQVSEPLKLACKIHFSMAIFGLILCVVFFAYLGFAAYIVY